MRRMCNSAVRNYKKEIWFTYCYSVKKKFKKSEHLPVPNRSIRDCSAEFGTFGHPSNTFSVTATALSCQCDREGINNKDNFGQPFRVNFTRAWKISSTACYYLTLSTKMNSTASGKLPGTYFPASLTVSAWVLNVFPRIRVLDNTSSVLILLPGTCTTMQVSRISLMRKRWTWGSKWSKGNFSNSAISDLWSVSTIIWRHLMCPSNR